MQLVRAARRVCSTLLEYVFSNVRSDLSQCNTRHLLYDIDIYNVAKTIKHPFSMFYKTWVFDQSDRDLSILQL